VFPGEKPAKVLSARAAGADRAGGRAAGSVASTPPSATASAVAAAAPAPIRSLFRMSGSRAFEGPPQRALEAVGLLDPSHGAVVDVLVALMRLPDVGEVDVERTVVRVHAVAEQVVR
jgi:hypothetical protein